MIVAGHLYSDKSLDKVAKIERLSLYVYVWLLLLRGKEKSRSVFLGGCLVFRSVVDTATKWVETSIVLAEWNRISKGFFFVREENYRLRRLGDRSKIPQNFPTRVKLSNKTICGINNRKKRYKNLRKFLAFDKANKVLLKESLYIICKH